MEPFRLDVARIDLRPIEHFRVLAQGKDTERMFGGTDLGVLCKDPSFDLRARLYARGAIESALEFIGRIRRSDDRTPRMLEFAESAAKALSFVHVAQLFIDQASMQQPDIGLLDQLASLLAPLLQEIWSDIGVRPMRFQLRNLSTWLGKHAKGISPITAGAIATNEVVVDAHNVAALVRACTDRALHRDGPPKQENRDNTAAWKELRLLSTLLMFSVQHLSAAVNVIVERGLAAMK